MKLVLATHNAHKVEELRRILGSQLEGIELIGYDGPEPVEDGDTFEANALIKARAASEYTGLPALADDSGICVDALGGAPGIYSARYAGTRDDTDNYRLLLANLGDNPNRAASFMCAAALVVPAAAVADAAAAPFEHAELGVWPGTIARRGRGSRRIRLRPDLHARWPVRDLGRADCGGEECAQPPLARLRPAHAAGARPPALTPCHPDCWRFPPFPSRFRAEIANDPLATGPGPAPEPGRVAAG